jgi:hypothetical protein
MRARDYVGAILLTLCVLGASPGLASSKPPPIRAVKQEPHHCGVACAETVLRAYGQRGAWTKQTAMGAALCARMPEFKARRPAASDAIESYYPQFKETYQPELAEFLIDHGYCVISTRSSADAESKKPLPAVWELLRGHLAQGHCAIIHVPGHYVVATGVDAESETLFFVDPWRADEVFSVPFDAFASGRSFHSNRSGEPRPGWDGRALIFWQGEPINQKDRCPVCGEVTAGKRHAYCGKCRCLIDRRDGNGVQLALDGIASCIRNDHITDLRRAILRRKLKRRIKSGEFAEADVRQALLHYPLVNSNPDRFETLHRYREREKVDLDALSLDDLIDIVAASDQWQAVLAARKTNGKS